MKTFFATARLIEENWTFWISAGTSFATWAIQRWSGKFWLGSCQCISWFAVGKAGPGQEQDLAGESGQSSPVSRLQQGTFASAKGGYHQEKCTRTLLARSFRASLCEMLLRPDAALERWFSIIHLVFDSGTKLAPDRVVNRLMLKEAGVSCTGGERDEHLISSLVQIFMQTLKKRPRLSRTGVAKRRRLGEKLDGSFATQGLALAANEQAAASGRDQAFREVDCPEHFEYHATDLPQQRKEWRQNHKPSLLDPGARNALQAAAGGREELSATTSLRALPFQVEDIRSVRKHRAPSDLQEKMNQWLQSEASSSWHDKRAALWE